MSTYKIKLANHANVDEDGTNKERMRAQKETLLMWETHYYVATYDPIGLSAKWHRSDGATHLFFS